MREHEGEESEGIVGDAALVIQHRQSVSQHACSFVFPLIAIYLSSRLSIERKDDDERKQGGFTWRTLGCALSGGKRSASRLLLLFTTPQDSGSDAKTRRHTCFQITGIVNRVFKSWFANKGFWRA